MILVTGATGIVGSHIVLALLQRGAAVRVLHRSESNLSVLTALLAYHSIQAEPEYVIGDVEDPISLEDAAQGCQTCYHAAALVSFNDSDDRRLAEVNTHGTEHIIDMCLRNGLNLAFISSTASIGDANAQGVRDEKSVWGTDKGKAAYTLSKRYAELAVFRGMQEGLEAVVVNPGVVIGPGNWGQSSTSIFLTGIKGMTFYPGGSNGFVDARDVADITVKMMDEPSRYRGQHLLIGGSHSFKEMFELLAEVAGTKGPTVRVKSAWIRTVIVGMRIVEFFGLNKSQLTANSLRSSISTHVYANKKVRDLGFEFRSIRSAAEYTFDVYTAGEQK
ncbi:MAG: NAD-dependent epimerase/dehydratase family protein [Flavobacteriales bacterium]|nr:NAD-dependent epimerase/dehydratase family protein [Flavobacteriales bacterium]